MILCITGIVVGIVLSVVGIMLAGAGHGSYLFLAIAAAPLSNAGIAFAVWGAPIFWGGTGFLLSKSSVSYYRRLFLAAILIHYSDVLFLTLYPASPYRDLSYVHGRYNRLVFAGLLYLCVQIAVWYLFFRTPSSAKER